MRQNVEKNVKCGHFRSNARGNAKLMINFFALLINMYQSFPKSRK